MTIYTKPNMTRVWAGSASGSDITDPDSVTPGKFAGGWGYEVPPYQYFNFVDNHQSQSLAYINQHGIGVWDANTEYAVNAQAKGSDGDIYLCLSQNIGTDPVGDLTADWELFQEDYKEMAGKRNYLINPSFRQNANSVVSVAEANLHYPVDRWVVNPIGAMDVDSERVANTMCGDERRDTYMLEVETNVASDRVDIFQAMESLAALPLDGYITLSFWAMADTDIDIDVDITYNHGSGGDSDVTVAMGTASLTSTDQKFVLTIPIGYDWSTASVVGADSHTLLILKSEDGIQSKMDFAQMKLETGKAATQFVRPPQEELYATCQRFYTEQQHDGTAHPVYNSTTNLARRLDSPFHTTMRVVPAVSFGSSGFTGTPTTGISVDQIVWNGTATGATTTTAITSWTASAEYY